MPLRSNFKCNQNNWRVLLVISFCPTQKVATKQTAKTTLTVADPDLELRGAKGSPLFLLALPVFFPLRIFLVFFFLPKIRGEGWTCPPGPSPRSSAALNDDDREERVQFFSNQRQCLKRWIC